MDYLIDPLYLFLSLTTFSLLFIIQLLPKRKSSNLPPGPTPFPIIGSLLELGDSPHRSISKIHKSHGPIISLKLGQTTTVVVASPELAKQVLQTLDSSISAHAVPHAFSALGHSHVSVIGMAPSPQWKHIRTILKTHLFSTQPLETNRCIRKKKVEEMVEHVRGRGRMGQTVDIGRAAICTMMNVLYNYFFSVDMVDINSVDMVADEFQELVCGVLEELGRPNVSDFFPVIRIMDLQGRKRKVEKYMNKLYLIFDDLIYQRLEKMKVMPSSLDGSHDFLDALVQLLVQGDSRLDRPSIKALLFDNFVAGSDTSSITVEWAMAELLRHPSIMEKAHAELVSVVGPKRQVEESDIPQLPFLHAIVKETFRLHPVAPLLVPHKAETDVELNGYMVPKNARVLVNVWAIGRDDSVWEDAESFRPERFMCSSKIDYRGRHFELTPFGSGRRICPGLPLAHRMVHLMLASLIHSFQWRLPDGMKASDVDMTDKFGITLSLVVPLPAIPLPVN